MGSSQKLSLQQSKDIAFNKNISVKNGGLQTGYAKHSDRVNVVYVDAHAAASKPSALTWGQFYDNFNAGVMLPTSYSTKVQSDVSISNPAYDSQQWSTTPE